MSAILTARQQVADYSAWRPLYDDADTIRARHGCTGQNVSRLPSDHNVVFVTHDFPTVEQAQAFADDPDLHAQMQKASVLGAPNLEIFETF